MITTCNCFYYYCLWHKKTYVYASKIADGYITPF